MPLRVLFLTPWYPDEKIPHHGVFVRDQARAISQSHEVTVISSKVDYSTFGLLSWSVKRAVFGKVTEYRLVIRRSLPLLNQVNYLLLSVFFSWKVARAFRPHIIHGNIAYPGGIWSYCLSRLTGVPFIISDHTSRFTDNFRSVFHRGVTLFALRRAKNVIAVSTWAANNIQPHLRRHVDIIPNVIQVNDYSIRVVPRPPVHVGFLGGLSTNRKGLDVLLEAIKGIARDYILHIGGTGKHLDYYKDLARRLGVSHNCRFHGVVEYVPDFMAELHFFVSSSRMEAFGMVIVEAMASGLPVVVTNSGGPADFVTEACGIAVPVGDVDRLRAAIEWMMDYYHTYDAKSIRDKIVRNYAPEVFAGRLERVYRGALQG